MKWVQQAVFWVAEKCGEGQQWKWAVACGGDASSCFTSSVRYGSSLTSHSGDGVRVQSGKSPSIGESKQKKLDRGKRSAQNGCRKRRLEKQKKPHLNCARHVERERKILVMFF